MRPARGLALAALCAVLGALVLVLVADATAVAGATDPPGEPIVREESSSDIGTTTATVSAEINPDGFPTTYRFEYGAGAVTEQTTPAETLGAGHDLVAVTARLTGLREDTTYRFRVVAENTPGSTTYTVTGAEQSFTTFYTLPDGRVFEMVNRPGKYYAEIYAPEAAGTFTQAEEGDAITTTLPFQASPDGDAVAYVGQTTSGGNGSVGGGDQGNQFLATRSAAGGWTPEDIAPSGHSFALYEAFSSDLSVGFVSSFQEPVLTPEAPGDEYDVLYSYTFNDKSYHSLFTTKPPNRSAKEFGTAGAEGRLRKESNERLLYAGASTGMKDLLFETNDALTPNAERHPPSKEQNDLYDSVGGLLNVINVLPGETEATPNASFGRIEGEEPNLSDFSHVISGDGSRIFWTDLTTGDLYVRENPASSEADTVQVDAAEPKPQCATCVGGGGRFWTASSDGSKVFFTDENRLTSNSTAEHGEHHRMIESGEPDLYEYEVNSESGKPGALTDLTVDTNAGEHANVQGVIGASNNGEYVYFVAKGILTKTRNPKDEGATSGSENLYLSHSGVTTFIATLSGEDIGRESPNGRTFGDAQRGLGNRTAEVAPDGPSVVFMSNRRLTGYAAGGRFGPMSEVFVYDAAADTLICASCNPDGEPPPVTEPLRAAYLPNSNSDTYLPRWISEDGSRVFFDSFEPLVPLDTNGKQDVYEWEREGAGSCPAGSAEGCIYLLSGGIGPNASFFIDASASGEDVFIASRAPLTAQENSNESLNLFDARVGGLQPHTRSTCSGTECQGVAPVLPVFATPASVTFTGVGNFPPPPPTVVEPEHKRAKCAKGKKRSHGKCVKTKRRKRKTKAKKRAKRSSRERRAE